MARSCKASNSNTGERGRDWMSMVIIREGIKVIEGKISVETLEGASRGTSFCPTLALASRNNGA